MRDVHHLAVTDGGNRDHGHVEAIEERWFVIAKNAITKGPND